MLPPLTAEGGLPAGVHPAPLNEILAVFGSLNAVRRDIAQRLQEILRMAHETGHLRRAFIWGSFVTAKPEPADIDLILVMSDAFRSEACPPSVRQIFDGEAAERVLGATILWVREDVPIMLLNAFLDQWQIDREGRRRGIVEVSG
jgi:uncharacterized protein DUF6932